MYVFFFQAEDGIRDATVTGVQTCALPISIVWNVERDTDPLHEMGHHDLRLDRLVVDRGPVHCVAARGVAAVGPVENTVLVVELDIDRLRQTIEEDLDIGPGRCSLAGGN